MNFIKAVIISSLALSFGWGHRGQFGGQRGAMLPGALIGLALARISDFQEVQSIHMLMGAVGAIGFAFGGSMTYGQTLGLTHNEPESDTYWWGLFGTTVKGSVWVGLGSIFIGMAAGWKPYSWYEVTLLLLALIPFWFIGIRILNRPMKPPQKLPRIYFSNPNDRPRTECWGGMWFVYIGLALYIWLVRRDSFAVGLSLFGLLGGGLGFTLGQMAQAYGTHKRPFGKRIQSWMDWWKVMEMSFGAIAGGVLGVGWWWLESHLVRDQESVTTILDPNIGIASVILWITIYLVASIGSLTSFRARFRPLRIFMSIVCLYGIAPIAGSFGSSIWQKFILLPLLIWVSSEDIIQYWRGKRRASQITAWVCAFVITLGTAGFMLVSINPYWIWAWILLSQSALSIVKVTLERFDALKKVTNAREIPRVYGAALTTEIVLILFILLLIII